jgi:hypothetical protein
MPDTKGEAESSSDSRKSVIAQSKARDEFGHFVKKVKEVSTPLLSTNDTPSSDPPLVSLKVTNPVTYFKKWWKKIIGNEGVDFRLHVKPLTAIALIFIIASGSFGIGLLVKLANQSPIIKYIPAFAASPTPDPWKDTAFSGLLKQTGTTFYLVTNDSEAITLSVPEGTNLTKYIGKRIFAIGRYNTQTGVLIVSEASDLEVLPINPTVVPTQ